MYESVEGNTLKGCVRGFQGVAKDWSILSLVSRILIEYDLGSVQRNIKFLDDKIVSEVNNTKNSYTTAKKLEDIGLDNTAMLEEVLTQLREKSTYDWNSLSIGIVDGMGLEHSMPLRGTGYLIIERHSDNSRGGFYMAYRGNIGTGTDDITRVFIGN